MLRWLGTLADVGVEAGLVRPTAVGGVRVVSVGGLTWGGAGKTPVAMAIAGEAHRWGLSVAVVLRGYGGEASRTGALVSDGARLLTDARVAGDEAVLHARRLPGVLVRIGADRVEAVRRARADGARLVVVDDGLQHRRLARDVEVICLGREGARRESDRALERADFVVAIGRPAPPIAARVVPAVVVARSLVRGPAIEPAGGTERIRGVAVALVSAIAHPERFRRTAEELGARVVSVRTRPDHAPLRGDDLRPPRGADLVLTTEKDLVKLERDPADVLGLRVAVEPSAPSRWSDVLDRVSDAGPARSPAGARALLGRSS